MARTSREQATLAMSSGLFAPVTQPCAVCFSQVWGATHPLYLLAKVARLASEVGPVMSRWGGSGDRGLWRFSLLILGTEAGLLSWESEKSQ